MSKPKLMTIAAALGVSQARASQLKKAGMPYHSISAALAWRAANVPPRFAPGTHALPGEAGARPDDANSPYDLTEARAKRETHEANLAEIKQRQLAGELVDVSRVEKYLLDAISQARMAIERIPDRLAERLAMEASPVACHEMLLAEIEQVLDELAEIKVTA